MSKNKLVEKIIEYAEKHGEFPVYYKGLGEDEVVYGYYIDIEIDKEWGFGVCSFVYKITEEEYKKLLNLESIDLEQIKYKLDKKKVEQFLIEKYHS